MPGETRVALVTGADRGIGLAVAGALASVGHRVYLSALPGLAPAAAAPLTTAGLAVEPIDLDVADDRSVAEAVRHIAGREARLDILINNAARGYDADRTVSTAELDEVRRTLETNLLGPWRLGRAVLPIMRANGYGRIVNVSSDAGSFAMVAAARVYPGTPAYSVSKAALDMLTVKLAAEVAGQDILVNAVDPGWVRTNMGGPDAPRSPAQAADEIVRLATLPPGGPSGRFFRDGVEIGW